jgi:3-dehydroquinate dehydratase-2
MLGTRQPEIYGRESLEDIKKMCLDTAEKLEFSVDFRQSNHEGEIITWIQNAYPDTDLIIINAGAYTHTSIAIHDALKIHDIPVIEVHLSDPKKRESFRHTSFIEPIAKKVICGMGAKGYIEALNHARKLLT